VNVLAIKPLAVVGHVSPAWIEGELSPAHALSALAALGQPTRLAIFKLLMAREPDGLPAGAIAEALECQQNTLSNHIAILARAGLVQGNRNGRSIIYRADVRGMRELLAFLVKDCCDGHPELCGFIGVKPEGHRARRPAARARKKDCGCGPEGRK
jgi:ArsR family transcriptional regulator, arsenate/arsenite/antimonite-responsive transcriptional repressor